MVPKGDERPIGVPTTRPIAGAISNRWNVQRGMPVVARTVMFAPTPLAHDELVPTNRAGTNRCHGHAHDPAEASAVRTRVASLLRQFCVAQSGADFEPRGVQYKNGRRPGHRAADRHQIWRGTLRRWTGLNS